MSLSARRFFRSSTTFHPEPPYEQVLLWDGRFTTIGKYLAPPGGFSGTRPPPYTHAEYEGGDNSNIVIYDTAGKQATWWPEPYTPWSTPLVGAFSSHSDGVTAKARAQCHEWEFREGDEFYWSWVIYVPSEIGLLWPSAGDDDWNVVMQFHGAPYNGSPPVAAGIEYTDNQLYLVGQTGTGYTTWEAPIQVDTWVHVVQHARVSKYGGQGLLETWVNGAKLQQHLPHTRANFDTSNQYLSDDGTTAYVATELSDTTDVSRIYLDNYRKGAGSNFGVATVTVFHMGMKVGETYKDVV